MDLFQVHNLSNTNLYRLNCSQLYLQVARLSDITNLEGTHLYDHILALDREPSVGNIPNTRCQSWSGHVSQDRSLRPEDYGPSIYITFFYSRMADSGFPLGNGTLQSMTETDIIQQFIMNTASSYTSLMDGFISSYQSSRPHDVIYSGRDKPISHWLKNNTGLSSGSHQHPTEEIDSRHIRAGIPSHTQHNANQTIQYLVTFPTGR